MMTLDEMKLAVCEKLPELITYDEEFKRWHWIVKADESNKAVWPAINWPTEGLQVCHEAEKLLKGVQWVNYTETLGMIQRRDKVDAIWHLNYEQRLESLCRVWWLWNAAIEKAASVIHVYPDEEEQMHKQAILNLKLKG